MKVDAIRLVVCAAAIVAVSMAGCGGPVVLVLEVDGPPIELGKTPPAVEGADYSYAVMKGSIGVLTVEEEGIVLDSYDLGDGAMDSEDLLNLQTELFDLTPEMIASAVMDPAFEELSPDDVTECLKSGPTEMARYVWLYEQGIVEMDAGLGIIFAARTPLKCPDQDIHGTVSIEHLMVFDENFSRTQHDTVIWIGQPPAEALPSRDGQTMKATWITSDGVWVSQGSESPLLAMGFVEPWALDAPPVHFLVDAPGSDLAFALGVIERPMAAVGQGESYLVAYLATADDPTYQEVVRIALPDHPQAAAAAYSGDELGVVMFAETLKPHAESSAKVHFVGLDDSGETTTELATVHEWKDPYGGVFGLFDIGIAQHEGSFGAAWLYHRDGGWNVDMVFTGPGAPTAAAVHELGWDEIESYELLSGPDDLLILWSETVMKLQHVPVP